MKTTLMCFAGLTFGIGLMDAGSPTPGSFLSSFGVCQFTNANRVTKLTIKANELQLACSDETHHTSASATSWSTSRGWFVYVAKEMRVWHTMVTKASGCCQRLPFNHILPPLIGSKSRRPAWF